MLQVNAIRTGLIIALLLSGFGCASMIRGTNDVLEVSSTPVRAEVEIYRVDRGFTNKELNRNFSLQRVASIKNGNEGKSANEQFAGPMASLTPASFSLARKGEYRIEITKQGYETVIVDIKNKLFEAGPAGMVVNVLIGGLIGTGIDARTGAMLNLTPNPVEVILEANALEVDRLEANALETNLMGLQEQRTSDPQGSYFESDDMTQINGQEVDAEQLRQPPSSRK